MRHRVTIKDIARKLGISHTTVSRALRDDARISQRTRTKVKDLAKKLGYAPNFAAAALSTGKTLSILFVVPYDLSKFPHLFHMEVFQGVAEEVSKYGYSVNVVLGDAANKGNQSPLELLTSARVDGAVSLLVHSNEKWVRETALPFPLVIVNQYVPEARADAVIAADKHGAFLATKHLIARGHRAIAHIAGPLRYYSPAQRLEGYREALSRYGLPFDKQMISIGALTRQGGYAALERLIRRGVHFTAISCCTDVMALGAIDALQEEKLAVPDDVSLVGFDDDVFASLIKPSLTTVRKPRRLMGREAGKILLGRINGTLGGQPVVSTLRTRLIVRDSSRTSRTEPSQLLDPVQ